MPLQALAWLSIRGLRHKVRHNLPCECYGPDVHQNKIKASLAALPPFVLLNGFTHKGTALRHRGITEHTSSQALAQSVGSE
jgi:hypothetical protein